MGVMTVETPYPEFVDAHFKMTVFLLLLCGNECLDKELFMERACGQGDAATCVCWIET